MDEELKRLKDVWDDLKPSQENLKECVYCGILASEKEHVIPKAYLRNVKDLFLLGFGVDVPEEIIVPACKECNMIAGAKVFPSFRAKKSFIREQLLIRYKKFRTFNPWTDEELGELSGRLKEHTFFFNEIAKIMKKRFDRLNK